MLFPTPVPSQEHNSGREHLLLLSEEAVKDQFD